MRNPFKRVSKEYVEKEIRLVELEIERLEEYIKRLRWRIRDLRKQCGISDNTCGGTE